MELNPATINPIYDPAAITNLNIKFSSTLCNMLFEYSEALNIMNLQTSPIKVHYNGVHLYWARQICNSFICLEQLSITDVLIT